MPVPASAASAMTSKVKVTSSHRLYVSSLPLIRETKFCTCVIIGGREHIPFRPNPAARPIVICETHRPIDAFSCNDFGIKLPL